MLLPVVHVHTPTLRVIAGGLTMPCQIGKHGVCAAEDKREGDGKTPLGRYPLRAGYFRPDRVDASSSALPMLALSPASGWCDDPADPAYNRPVSHPYPASAEQLWREDGLYDLIISIGHNDAPVVPGLGSAIFWHCAKWDEAGAMKPTLGCVAMARDDLLALLPLLAPTTVLDIL
jgi:L,D-peptidoglycan transpeptidase YkuD (ErfK/YbiS/YcfS/YnhG family)